MMKDNKVLFVVLSLFLVVLMVDAVSAQSFFKDIAKEWETGNLGDVTVRVLFAFIVLMLIMTVVDRLPGLGNDESKSWMRWLIGIIVTLLATAYIKIGELKATLFGYSALGFTMAIAVPFLILLFFSYDMLSPKKSGIKQAWMRKGMVYIIWLGFAGFLLYRIIKLSGGSISVSEPLKYAHYILFALAVFVILFMGKITKKITSSYFTSARGDIKRVLDDASAKEEAERIEIETLRASTDKFRTRKSKGTYS